MSLSLTDASSPPFSSSFAYEVVVEPAAPAALSVTTSPPPSVAGAKFSVGVSAVDAYGNVVTFDNSDAVRLALQHGSATPKGAELTCTKSAVPVVDGVASFACSISTAGAFTLVATAPNLVNAVSSPVQIVASAPSQLRFVREPPQLVSATKSFTATVAIEDKYGNVSLVASNTVTLTLSGGSSGAALTCNADPLNASAGKAAFTCSISQPGKNYVLNASSPSLKKATSTKVRTH